MQSAQAPSKLIWFILIIPKLILSSIIFLSTYFDGFTLPEIWKWAKVLPYLHVISEDAAVCFAQHLSDAVLAERSRIYSSDKEVAQ